MRLVKTSLRMPFSHSLDGLGFVETQDKSSGRVHSKTLRAQESMRPLDTLCDSWSMVVETPGPLQKIRKEIKRDAGTAKRMSLTI
jgi:hypothetical protein